MPKYKIKYATLTKYGQLDPNKIYNSEDYEENFWSDLKNAGRAVEYISDEEIIDSDEGINAKVDGLSAELAEKASKEEVANVLDGSPKGTFLTLTDLETAYPTGTTGVYIVQADGHIYSWDGSAWVDRGQYQSTGIAEDSISQKMLDFKFNGLDAAYLSDRILVENLTTTARVSNETVSFTPTPTADMFIRIITPATAFSSVYSFAYINGDYTKTIQNTSSSGSAFAFIVNGITTPDAVPYNTELLFRIHNDNGVTKAKIYKMDGTLVTEISGAQTLELNGIVFKSTALPCYDVTVFDKILTDAEVGKHFFGSELIIDSIVKDADTFQFKTQAKYVTLANGDTVENKLQTSRHEGKTGACFGDSITGAASSPYDYPSHLSNATGLNAINCGISGTRMAFANDSTFNLDVFSMAKLADAIATGNWTAQDAVTLDSTRAEKYANMKAVNYSTLEYMTIFFGTNDYTGTKKLDNPDNLKDITYFGGATRYALETILTAHPHIKILLVSPMYRDRWGTDGDGLNSDIHPVSGFYLYDYVTKLEEIAKEFHLPFLNLYDTSNINKYTAGLYLYDGLHPDYAGTELLGSKIAGEILRAY